MRHSVSRILGFSPLLNINRPKITHVNHSCRLKSVLKMSHVNLDSLPTLTSGVLVPKHNPPLIVTHDGIFHADDVLACFMLKLLPELKDAVIIRTRDENIINDGDIVVDVGAVYDHSKHRYDHHQRTFNETMDSLSGGKYSFTIKLSSAGLVYFHFGQRIISAVLETTDEALIRIAFVKVYERFIREVDAIDNGISMCDKPRFDIHTSVSARIKHFLPQWNEPSTPDILMSKFKEAMQMMGGEFLREVSFYGNVWWPLRQNVLTAVDKRFDVDPSGMIIDLGSDGSYPWKEHLFMIEEDMGLTGHFKFVLFQDTNGKYRVQSVPIESHSFELRVGLHPDWRGLRDSVLDLKVGIEGCIFVHASGFIGGHKTREGALRMALLSLDAVNN